MWDLWGRVSGGRNTWGGNALIPAPSSRWMSELTPCPTRTRVLAVVSVSGLTRLLQRASETLEPEVEYSYLITDCTICGNLVFGITWLSPNYGHFCGEK